jgi:2-methylisocitrate lyase-like PEP mutase family enzyme
MSMTNPMTNEERRKQFRQRVEKRNGMVVPGAFNALSARVIADQGYEAAYLTGAGLTNMYYGAPDLGIIGLRDVAECTARMREVIDLPLIVDGDTGFGNAVNVWHTVRTLEAAGADAIQLEDQTFPKRCGHFAGKDVAPLPEMLAKIRAAADARRDSNFLIIARTDSRAMLGFDAAIDRAHQFSEAGADILFVEAVESLEEVRQLPKLFDKPQLINIVIGGKTPALDASELGQMGFGIILYANAALQGAVLGMQRALGSLKQNGRLEENSGLVAPFLERQRLVNKPLYDELEKRYVS